MRKKKQKPVSFSIWSAGYLAFNATAYGLQVTAGHGAFIPYGLAITCLDLIWAAASVHGFRKGWLALESPQRHLIVHAHNEKWHVTARRWRLGWELHIAGEGVTQCRKLEDAARMVGDYLAARYDLDPE